MPDDAQLQALREGVELNDGRTRPALARLLETPPPLWPRDPPVRFRKTVADAWLELVIAEGRNRQVRRMTAAVGLPTLRLVRVAIGDWQLRALQPGEWRALPDSSSCIQNPFRVECIIYFPMSVRARRHRPIDRTTGVLGRK